MANEERKPVRQVATAFCVMCGLVLLYVFSSGPVLKLCQRSATLDGALNAYAPLIWCCDRSETAASLWMAYLELWQVEFEIEFRAHP